MSLTTQCPQTGVHRYLTLLGLMMEMPQQDVGRVIDIEHDTLRAVTADLNNDWPFKSARAGHHSPFYPERRQPRSRIFPQPHDSAASPQLNLIAGVQAIVMSAFWFMSGGAGFG